MPGLGFAAGAAEGINDSSNIAYKQALIAQQRQQMAMQREQQLREQEGRKDIGQTLAGMYPEFAQAPNPGQSSAPPPVQPQGQALMGGGGQPILPGAGVPGAAAGPMAPPMQQPRQMPPQAQPQGMPQGGSAAPPQAGGFNFNNIPRPGAGDNPNNAGPAPTDAIPPYQTVQPPEPQAQPQGGSAAPPPVEQKTPDLSNAFSPQHLVQVMQKQGIPQERWAGVIGGMQPLFKEVTEEQQRHLEYEKTKASEAHQRYMELLGVRRADQADAREDRMQSALVNTMRHQGVTEGQGAQRIGQGDKRITDSEKKNDPNAILATFFPTEESKRSMVAQIVAGKDPIKLVPYSKDRTAIIGQLNALASESIAKTEEISPEEAGKVLVLRQMDQHAAAASLTSNAKQIAVTEPMVQTLDYNLEQAKLYIKEAAPTESQWLNHKINELKKATTSQPKLRELAFQIEAIQDESARILKSNPNMTGVSSDSAKEDLKKIISGDIPVADALAVAERIRTDGEKRLEFLKGQGSKIIDRHIGKGYKENLNPGAGSATTIPDGWTIKEK
jgi:hypothetical protein